MRPMPNERRTAGSIATTTSRTDEAPSWSEMPPAHHIALASASRDAAAIREPTITDGEQSHRVMELAQEVARFVSQSRLLSARIITQLMSLTPCTRLGPYEILPPLGADEMAARGAGK